MPFSTALGVEPAKALVVTTLDPDRKLSITLMAHSRNPRR